MKRMIMAMVALMLMVATMSAQRIDNANVEARVLTEKMVEELGLSNSQKEKVYQANLSYMNGINGYSDINSQAWKQRNSLLKSIFTSSQWKGYKKASYFYRPISWRNNTYVHNVYTKYPSAKSSTVGSRSNKQTAQHATKNNSQRYAQTTKSQQKNTASYNKGNASYNNGNASYNKNNVSYNKGNASYGKDNGNANVKNNASGNRSFGNMRR